MQIDKFENEYTKIWIKDGILYSIYFPNLKITLDIAKKCVHDRIEFTKGISYPMLADIRNIRSTDKDARDYLSKGESTLFIEAGAFVIKTQIEKILGNMFIKVSKPIVPAKLFTEEKAALQWLQQFRRLN